MSRRMIFVHGKESSSRGFKATLLRRLFPDMVIPDFSGALDARMAQLGPVLNAGTRWTIVGSSMGGLMAALFTCRHPDRVEKLVLLAPALSWPEFADHPPEPVSVPTVVYHGRRDTVVPMEPVRAVCDLVFSALLFHVVDDDHRLHQTVQAIDWSQLIGRS